LLKRIGKTFEERATVAKKAVIVKTLGCYERSWCSKQKPSEDDDTRFEDSEYIEQGIGACRTWKGHLSANFIAF
jgi:hypothetical protein